MSHDQFETLGELRVAGHQVVVNDDFVAATLERMRGMTANVSCSSNHENGQSHLSRTRVFSRQFKNGMIPGNWQFSRRSRVIRSCEIEEKKSRRTQKKQTDGRSVEHHARSLRMSRSGRTACA